MPAMPYVICVRTCLSAELLHPPPAPEAQSPKGGSMLESEAKTEWKRMLGDPTFYKDKKNNKDRIYV
eukprot:14009732-Alexandrium_andersonii.AAC.1